MSAQKNGRNLLRKALNALRSLKPFKYVKCKFYLSCTISCTNEVDYHNVNISEQESYYHPASVERPSRIRAMLSTTSEEGPGSRPRRVYEAVSRRCDHTENCPRFLVQVIDCVIVCAVQVW